jgi:hypothetical protein
MSTLDTLHGIRAVTFTEDSVGRTFSDSKTKTTWTVQIRDESKQISLTNSRISGKKKVFVDCLLIHETSTLFGGFTFSFRLLGTAFLIAQNAADTGYDLFVNGVNFFGLPGSPSPLPSAGTSRPPAAPQNEDLQLQRAIELSLLDERKRNKSQTAASTQPPRVPPPKKRPPPAPATTVIPDLIDLFPPVVVEATPVTAEEFDMTQNSPLSYSAEPDAVRKSSSVGEDPIMDWFKGKASLMDAAIEADVPPIQAEAEQVQKAVSMSEQAVTLPQQAVTSPQQAVTLPQQAVTLPQQVVAVLEQE